MKSVFPFLVTILLTACAPASQRRVGVVLDDVESYINDRPDSALAVLRGLDSTAVIRRPAQRARAALLHSMALDKCYIDLQTDSILAPAVAWYRRHGTPDERLKTHYYLGRLQYNAGDYQEAIVTYTEALELTKNATDLKYVGLVNQAIADTYAASYQDSESFPYLDRAYEAFLQIPDSVSAKKTLYKKAQSLTKQQVWDQADSLYRLLLTHSEGIQSLKSHIMADYALHLVLSDLDNADLAATLFMEADDGSGAMRSPNLWGAYAFCLSRIGESKLADEIFRQLAEVYPTEKRAVYWRSLKEADAKKYKEALEDFKEVAAYQDSLVSFQLNHSTLLAQKEFFENHALVAQQAVRRRTQVLWGVIFLSCLIAGMLTVILRQRIKRQRRDNVRLQQTIEAVNRQLANAGEEQSVLKQQLNLLFQDYFSMLGGICADYEEGRLDRTHASDRAVLRRLDRIIWDFTGKSGDHEAFEQLLDKHIDHIMTDFRKDFPKMREQAYFLVGYIFAGLDMPTISVLMGVDVDALYARKYRIKSEIIKSSSLEKSRYLELFR